MADNQGQRAKAAAFDLEGTIVDLESLHHASHLKAAAQHGIHLSWEQAVLALPHFIGGPDEQVASELASIATSPVKPEDILRDKQEHFYEQFLKIDRVSLRPGFLPFLEWLTKLGIVIVIGTVSAREFAQVLLHRSGVSRLFPGLRLVAREDVEHPKPAPDVYIKTAELCGVSCRQQLVFEDSPVGVRAAKLAQCRIIAIPAVHSTIVETRLAQEGAEAIFQTWDNPELKTRALDIISTR